MDWTGNGDILGRKMFFVVGLLAFFPITSNTYSQSERLFANINTNNLVINQVQPEVQRHDGNLTIFELVILSKLQNFVEGVIGIEKFRDPFWISTEFLKNLLDSTGWNAKKAQLKFKKVMGWKNREPTSLESEILDEMLQTFAVEIKTYDKEGCPVIILPVGQWRTYRSFLGKVKSVREADNHLDKYFAIVMEQLLHQVKNRNTKCSQVSLIADIAGYSFLHSSGISKFLAGIKQFEKQYPGVLKIAFIINSTPAFLRVAQAFKTAIPWDLRRKTFIYTDKEHWRDAILTAIDASQLPPTYGGTNFFLE